MRKILVSTLALAGLFGPTLAVPAFAADLPSNKEPPPVYVAPPVPVFTWTGFYGGAEGGVDFLRESGHFNPVTTRATALTPFKGSRDAGLLGGFAGFNYQIGGLVLGLEGNADGVLGAKRTARVLDPALNTIYNVSANPTYDADLRGRVGWAMDRALFWAAGGVAFGGVNTMIAPVGGANLLSSTASRTGFTAGAGVDYAFTNNLFGRVEYRYTDLGTANFNNAVTGASEKMRFNSNAALVGLGFKFGN